MDNDDSTGRKTGERIAKVLARRGVASRRAAEAIIAAGRIAVNGTVIDSPALNVTPRDRITLDGQPIADEAPARLWLYHKPAGLVTTERDEKDRPTVFAALPPELGRVMSVGRLDITSEGLLLLTNDGALKRRLELPSTGWLRKYRVRVNGMPAEATFAPLRDGLVIDGERFKPMEVTLDRQQGANAWLTVGIREGRNREVRRAMEAVGLTVNRLIRVSYGPFRLGELKAGAVEEVRARVLRDQLGLAPAREAPGQDPEAGGTAQGKAKAKGSGRRPATGGAPGAGRHRPPKPGGARDATGPRGIGKPTGKPTGKPIGKPIGKSIGKSIGKPGKAAAQPGKPGKPAHPAKTASTGKPWKAGKPAGARPGGAAGGKPEPAPWKSGPASGARKPPRPPRGGGRPPGPRR